MSLITVDVVFDLPPALRERALRLSAVLVERMWRAGHPSRFQLGHPFPAGDDPAGTNPADPANAADFDGGVCEPHVSLFMLQVTEPEIGEVLAAVRSVAAGAAPIVADGHEYRHNPQGAPELYYRRSPPWRALQGAVVAAVEPLRRGRLRDVDPAGERLDELIEHLRREEPHGARLRQLLAYGYNEISDNGDDRFRPHVTLAWPVDAVPGSLAGLPGCETLGGVLTELAVYRMSGNGTCTLRYGGFALDGGGLVASASPERESGFDGKGDDRETRLR